MAHLLPAATQSNTLLNLGITVEMGTSPLKSSAELVPAHRARSDDDSLRYTGDVGANTSKLTYQEDSGDPVEINSPLGYSVGWGTVIFLNLSKMIGTGVFSTRAFIQIPRKNES